MTRTLRLANGPDEVHHFVLGRPELDRYDDQEVDKALYQSISEGSSTANPTMAESHERRHPPVQAAH
jgi:hypothetical protein